jgi:hypothetical protein
VHRGPQGIRSPQQPRITCGNRGPPGPRWARELREDSSAAVGLAIHALAGLGGLGYLAGLVLLAVLGGLFDLVEFASLLVLAGLRSLVVLGSLISIRGFFGFGRVLMPLPGWSYSHSESSGGLACSRSSRGSMTSLSSDESWTSKASGCWGISVASENSFTSWESGGN